MLSRDEALAMLQAEQPEQNQINHCLESEAVLRRLAEELGEDVELWGLAGLLHDIDFATTKEDPERHGLVAAEMLAGRLPDEAIGAIKAHNGGHNGTPVTTRFDHALRCGETVTGLVAANALVRPTGMTGMKPKSLKKKMKDKAFARRVNRDVIRECSELGLELGDFLRLAIEAIAPLAEQVGLSGKQSS